MNCRGIKAVAVAVLSASLGATVVSAETPPTAPLTPAPIEPAPIDNRDDDLAKLLKRRHNAALEEVQALEGLYRDGRVLIYQLLAAQQRLAVAGVEMAAQPADRLKYYQSAVDAARTNEQIVRARWKAGLEGAQTMYYATAMLQTAEIDLNQARAAEGGTKPGDKESLARLLGERHQNTAKEAEALDALYRVGRVPLEQVMDAHQRLASSGDALYATPQEREEHLDKQIKQARAIEAIAQEKFDHEIEPRHTLLEARQLRLDLEISRIQAQLAAMPAAPGDARLSQREALDAKLQALLKERFDAAAAEVGEKRALYRTGRIGLHELAAAVRRQVHAGISQSRSPADEIPHYQAALDATKEFEALVRAKVEQGFDTTYAAHFATGERLTAEIGLVRARRAAARQPANR